MTICILHPSVCKTSAKNLALEIGAVLCNPFQTDKRDFTEYDLVFNYGCNRNFKGKKIINTGKSVGVCVDKLKTFYKLAKNNVPVVSFTEYKEEIPKHWEDIVCRVSKTDNQAKSLEYVAKGAALPPAELYTEYYEHKFEFRIMVFMGKVVGRYLKDEQQGNWVFEPLEPIGFEEIDKQCLKAAEVLGIDFVGFDVLANSQKKFKILEANSGPTLTEEVKTAIKEYLHV